MIEVLLVQLKKVNKNLKCFIYVNNYQFDCFYDKDTNKRARNIKFASIFLRKACSNCILGTDDTDFTVSCPCVSVASG